MLKPSICIVGFAAFSRRLESIIGDSSKENTCEWNVKKDGQEKSCALATSLKTSGSTLSALKTARSLGRRYEYRNHQRFGAQSRRRRGENQRLPVPWHHHRYRCEI